LSQFSFNDGTERKALTLSVMITMTMTINDNDIGATIEVAAQRERAEMMLTETMVMMKTTRRR